MATAEKEFGCSFVRKYENLLEEFEKEKRDFQNSVSVSIWGIPTGGTAPVKQGENWKEKGQPKNIPEPDIVAMSDSTMKSCFLLKTHGGRNGGGAA